MPRTPILNREGYYKTLTDGTIVDLDWNVVNTSLGAMLEPRQVTAGLGMDGAAIDAVDAGYSRRLEYDEDLLVAQFNTGGRQLPVSFGV